MMKLPKETKTKLEEIYKSVENMEFSDDNLLDLYNFIDTAIQIAKQIEPNRRKNECLNQLIQTRDKQRAEMISKDVDDVGFRFGRTKAHFLMDITMFCCQHQ